MVVKLKRKAFSYIRFSSKAQEMGDSIRRQLEVTRAWAARNDIELDESLRIDRGLSGYKGKNRTIGSLAEFLYQVEKGNVPPGSFLVVESLDRLTRQEGQEALLFLLNMMAKGIRIVQLTPVEMVYDKSSDTRDLIFMICELSRGHSESKVKSERVGKARKEERKVMREGANVGHQHPQWVTMKDGRYVLIPDRAAVVRRIFELALDGMGIARIARTLTQERVKPFGKLRSWQRAYIHRILRDGRAAGFCQPKAAGRRPDGPPVAGYYPAVVSRDEQLRAQSGLAQRLRLRGSPGASFVNPFAGLLVDGLTRERLVCNPVKRGGRSWRLLVTQSAGTRLAPWSSFSYDALERGLVARMKEVNPRQLSDDQAGGAAQLDAAEGHLDELVSRQADIAAALAKRPTSETLLQAADEIDEALTAARERLETLQRENATPAAQTWEECKGLLDVLDAADDEGRARMRLRQVLRTLIQSVTCVITSRATTRLCAAQILFYGGHTREYLIARRKAVGGSNPAKFKPAVWGVGDYPRAAGGAGPDFRKPEDVAAVKRWLDTFDLSELTLWPEA